MKKLTVYLIMVLMVMTIIGSIFGLWYIGRYANYQLLYKGFVKETVREMVKEEALKGDG